ncbi:hypothetical protein NONI108955_05865 [Nocardia ninae]|uniref:Uncharacterized protein n=1 Tax=Nocardia ninae NBRC 108245 TaxID=1210091 RepID=A0A511MEC2_9NOCA|nr:hypothetical protein [Nocardia ninae]GEM38831.1 hypothetical protein NN4_33500 [Nocardia ninae NBRC 108245]
MGIADDARRRISVAAHAQQAESERRAASEAEFKRLVAKFLPETFTALLQNRCQPDQQGKKTRSRKMGYWTARISHYSGDKDTSSVDIRIWVDGSWDLHLRDGFHDRYWIYDTTPDERLIRRSFVSFLEGELQRR